MDLVALTGTRVIPRLFLCFEVVGHRIFFLLFGAGIHTKYLKILFSPTPKPVSFNRDTLCVRGVAVISAKNHKRQRRKRQSVTPKREKSQTPKVLTAILTLPSLT